MVLGLENCQWPIATGGSGGVEGDLPDIWNIRYWFVVAVVLKSANEILCSLSYFPTRYKMIAPDSQIAKSLLAWSTRVGMRPLGLRSVYGAFLCSPFQDGQHHPAS